MHLACLFKTPVHLAILLSKHKENNEIIQRMNTLKCCMSENRWDKRTGNRVSSLNWYEWGYLTFGKLSGKEASKFKPLEINKRARESE